MASSTNQSMDLDHSRPHHATNKVFTHAKDFKDGGVSDGRHAPEDSYEALTAGTLAQEHGNARFVSSLDGAKENQEERTDTENAQHHTSQSRDGASTQLNNASSRPLDALQGDRSQATAAASTQVSTVQPASHDTTVPAVNLSSQQHSAPAFESRSSVSNLDHHREKGHHSGNKVFSHAHEYEQGHVQTGRHAPEDSYEALTAGTIAQDHGNAHFVSSLEGAKEHQQETAEVAAPRPAHSQIHGGQLDGTTSISQVPKPVSSQTYFPTSDNRGRSEDRATNGSMGPTHANAFDARQIPASAYSANDGLANTDREGESDPAAANKVFSHKTDFQHGQVAEGRHAPEDSHEALTAGTLAQEHGNASFLGSLQNSKEHQEEGLEGHSAPSNRASASHTSTSASTAQATSAPAFSTAASVGSGMAASESGNRTEPSSSSRQGSSSHEHASVNRDSSALKVDDGSEVDVLGGKKVFSHAEELAAQGDRKHAPEGSVEALSANTVAQDHGNSNFISSVESAEETQEKRDSTAI